MALVIPPDVLRQLAAMPKKDRERLLDALELVAAEPARRLAFVTRMVGQPGVWRLRKGDGMLDRVGHRKDSVPVTEIKILPETPDTVTLRRADFQALVAAAADAADLTAVRAHSTYEDRVGWQAARRNYLSRREVLRLLDSESPVRVWREKRGLSQRALAAAAQISPSYLAEIEAGRKPGSKNALLAVATVLEVLLEDLVHPPGISPQSGPRGAARSYSPRGSSR